MSGYHRNMTPISVQEIADDPIAFVDRIKAKESFLVVSDDVAIAQVQPLPQMDPEPRPFGLASGEFNVPDDFDQPLSECCQM